MRNDAVAAADANRSKLKKVTTKKRKVHWGRNVSLPDDNDDDDDFMERPLKRKRRLAQEAGSSQGRQQSAATSSVQDQPNAVNEARVSKGCTTRCSPNKFRSFVDALSDKQKDDIDRMGFGGLLSFKPNCLDRDLLIWLMGKLNLETMKLEIGGGKEIDVDEHSIDCVLRLPSKGGDPPLFTDKEGHIARELVARRVVGMDVKVSVKDLTEMLIFKECDDAFAVRCFFIVAFNLLLFPNTDSYIRGVDAKWSENVESIANINWCKVVVDNLRFSAHLFHKEDLKEHPPTYKVPIYGCGIFLNPKSIYGTCYRKL